MKKFFEEFKKFISRGNVVDMAVGVIPLMNNHSILHTSILMLFVKFGMLFKSVNLGVFVALK